MMTGPDSAKMFVCNYLRYDLQRRLPAYRNFLGVPEEELPVPNGYKPYAPPSLEHMGDELPVIYTVIISTEGIQRIDYTTTMDPIYRVTYATRTFVWVKQDGDPDDPERNGLRLAVKSRDNLMTVVRASLLDHQCLSIAAQHENTEVKFDEASLREEYSEAIAEKGDRWAAGGYLSYFLTIDEVVTREAIGEVAEMQVEGLLRPRFLDEE